VGGSSQGGHPFSHMDLVCKLDVPGWKIQLINISDLETELDRYAKADPDCLTKLKDSIESVGMRWPILITPGSVKKYKCYIGNTRVDYAIKHGYKRISAILIKDSWDKLQIQHYWAKTDALKS
jgi:ParB-like chromosome segregation protein Spo0J